jgi:2-polyprenyl-6-methoxyphenol hydroxylase-like FAD-dependent oxidoreductase
MTDILISGAGIAGTSLAYWLSRQPGVTCTVVERADRLRDGGYKVDIRGAALTVVERMGLLDEVRAHRTDVRTGSVVNAAGKKVASMNGDTFGGRVHGDAELLRGELNRLIFQRSRDAVDYRFGEAIASLQDGPDGVEVVFSSGERRVFDLVVGADGVHSRTRELAFGPGGVRDLGYYVSIFSVPNHLGLDREELTYVGPGRTALVYSTAGQDEAKAMFLFSSPPLRYDPRDRAAQEQLLFDAYRNEGWEVPKLLRAMPDAPDLYFDSLSQVHLDGWSSGRVALVGDAAHAPSFLTGQGTSTALVGAYMLAHALATTPDHETAFTAYERDTRGFVTLNQNLVSEGNATLFPTTAEALAARNAMLSRLTALPAPEGRPEHSAITLPDLVTTS